MYCSREYQASTRLIQQYEKSTLNEYLCHYSKWERSFSRHWRNGEDTAIGSESFPQLIQMHQQHWADYVHLSAEEGLTLTLGEDTAAPLVMEVQFMLFRFSIFCDHLLLIPYSAFVLYSLFQVLQKIQLANHIRKMAELLHVDAVQQLGGHTPRLSSLQCGGITLSWIRANKANSALPPEIYC